MDKLKFWGSLELLSSQWADQLKQIGYGCANSCLITIIKSSNCFTFHFEQQLVNKTRYGWLYVGALKENKWKILHEYLLLNLKQLGNVCHEKQIYYCHFHINSFQQTRFLNNHIQMITTNPLIEINLAVIKQGVELTRTISADEYQRKATHCFNSTIGGHMRHNIDHYLAFINGLKEGTIDYDSRERQEVLEKDPHESCSLLEQIHDELEELSSIDLDTPLTVIMDEGNDCHPSASSIRRELQFLISHTIHHYALIVSIGRLFGLTFPDSFGVAPSTIKHRAQLQR